MCQVAALHSVNYMQSARSPAASFNSDTASALPSVSFLALSSRSDVWLARAERKGTSAWMLAVSWVTRGSVSVCWGVCVWGGGGGCCQGRDERVRIAEWMCSMSSVAENSVKLLFSCFFFFFFNEVCYWQPASQKTKKCNWGKLHAITVRL